MMKLSERSLALACAAAWGTTALAVGLANLWGSPYYGTRFLELLDALYPGYRAERTLDGVLVLTGYAVCHGGAAGWFVGWCYNRWSK
jgi:hypothetical protein